jgi:general L-amino acid transport system substrate-binding protein
MATAAYLFEGISLLEVAGAGEKPGSINGADVCFVADAMAADWYRQKISDRKGKPSEVANIDELKAVMEAGGCPFIAGQHFSLLGLSGEKSGLQEGFFGVLSYAPLVRQGDDQWFHVVREVTYMLMRASENNLTQEGARSIEPGSDIAAPLQAAGLGAAWPQAVILATGNLQEIFDRNFRAGTNADKPAGLNASWNDGGLWLAPVLP